MLAYVAGAAVLAVVGQHLQHLQIYRCGLPWEVLQNFFGVLYNAHHNGHLCLLCDLEGAVAERQQRLLGFVGLSLRINAHRDYVLVQQLHRFIDGLDRSTVILAIQRQTEAHMHQLINDRDFEILLFGNKGKGKLRKLCHRQYRIEDSAVVAYQQKAGIPRDLLPSGHIHAHPQQEHTHLHNVGHQPVVEAGTPVGGAVDADKD